MAIVVDAYITLPWCFPDEQTSLSLNVLLPPKQPCVLENGQSVAPFC